MIPKFRAWYTPFKGEEFGQEMKYGQAGSLLTHAEMSPDKYVLMQSTGLKDKSAKYEINNKDILLVDTFPESSFKAKVVYESGSFGVVALKGDIVDYFPKHWNDTFMPLAELYWIFDCEDGVLDCVEILGNEFENPELLEEQ